MRILVVACILLAGCSKAPLEAEGPLSPLPDENQTRHFDDVRGTIHRSGTYHSECSAVSGYGSLLPQADSLPFAVPANATRMAVEATWDAPNPTAAELDFLVSDGKRQTAFFGPSPAGKEIAADFFGSPPEVLVAPPACRNGATVAVYEGLAVDVVIRFS